MKPILDADTDAGDYWEEKLFQVPNGTPFKTCHCNNTLYNI
jgi:hypothetical protein